MDYFQATLNYAIVMNQSRTAQLICVTLELFLLYANLDYMSTIKFVFVTVLCLYNLYAVGMRWSKNTDGRFDFRQMLKTSDPQLKLIYALDVFGPTIIGFLMILMVHFPGGASNFLWTMICCMQIAASAILLAMEAQEAVVRA